MKKRVKFISSLFVLMISSLLFNYVANASSTKRAGFCKSCGDFQSCFEGAGFLQCGWEECEVVTGWPPCEVSGSYGPCQGGANCQD